MNQADRNNLAYIGRKPGDTPRDPDSWFTPKLYIELVRGALGGAIDFDQPSILAGCATKMLIGTK